MDWPHHHLSPLLHLATLWDGLWYTMDRETARMEAGEHKSDFGIGEVWIQQQVNGTGSALLTVAGF